MIVSRVGFTCSASVAVCVCAGVPLSDTVIDKFEIPLVVGVPEITPALDRVSPAGRLPALSFHVYPGVPPLALSVAEYAAPTFAAFRVVVPIVTDVITVIDGETARLSTAVLV
jgi:hypothetical protein